MSNTLTRSVNKTQVGKLWLCFKCNNILIVKPPFRISYAWCGSKLVFNFVFCYNSKQSCAQNAAEDLYPTSISVTPRHLLGSPRLPLLGTGVSLLFLRVIWRSWLFLASIQGRMREEWRGLRCLEPWMCLVVRHLIQVLTRWLGGVSSIHLQGAGSSRMDYRHLWWSGFHQSILVAWLWGWSGDRLGLQLNFNAFPCLCWHEVHLVYCLGLVHWPCILGEYKNFCHFRLCYF